VAFEGGRGLENIGPKRLPMKKNVRRVCLQVYCKKKSHCEMKTHNTTEYEKRRDIIRLIQKKMRTMAHPK